MRAKPGWADISQGFGVADILGFWMETSGFKAEEKTALYSSDLHVNLPIIPHYIEHEPER